MIRVVQFLIALIQDLQPPPASVGAWSMAQALQRQHEYYYTVKETVCTAAAYNDPGQ